MQIQNSTYSEALQSVRLFSLFISDIATDAIHSFELGGEKKTKGAALTFVRLFSSEVEWLSYLLSRSVSVSFCCIFFFPVILRI